MVLDIVITKTDDGYEAEVPSIHGCECWAHTEFEVLAKTVELARFYLKLDPQAKIKIDKARGNFTVQIYKLIFNKVN